MTGSDTLRATARDILRYVEIQWIGLSNHSQEYCRLKLAQPQTKTNKMSE